MNKIYKYIYIKIHFPIITTIRKPITNILIPVNYYKVNVLQYLQMGSIKAKYSEWYNSNNMPAEKFVCNK